MANKCDCMCVLLWVLKILIVTFSVLEIVGNCIMLIDKLENQDSYIQDRGSGHFWVSVLLLVLNMVSEIVIIILVLCECLGALVVTTLVMLVIFICDCFGSSTDTTDWVFIINLIQLILLVCLIILLWIKNGNN